MVFSIASVPILYKIVTGGHVFIAILSKINRASLINNINDCREFEANQ